MSASRLLRLPGTALKSARRLPTLRPRDIGPTQDLPAGTILTEQQLLATLLRPNLLMQSGAHAGVRPSASENAHTKKFLEKHNGNNGIIHLPDTDLCTRALAATYRHKGHKVVILPPQPGSIDGHYSTDSNKTFRAALLIHDDIEVKQQQWELGNILSLTPQFTHEHRQLEAPWKREYLETSKQNKNPQTHHRIIEMQQPMEFGDTRIVFKNGDGFILAGCANSDEIAIGRSTEAGHREFEQHLQRHIHKDITVHTIHLRQPFYHMDTTGPVTFGSEGPLLWTTPEAYTPESWGKLLDIFGKDNIIQLPFTDINDAFGGNATQFADNVYISDKVSDRTVGQFAERGFNVFLTPIDETIASGGGHRCMTSVSHLYVEGGFPGNIGQILGLGQKTGMVHQVTIDRDKGTFELHEINSRGERVNGMDLTPLAMDHATIYQQEKARVEYQGK